MQPSGRTAPRYDLVVDGVRISIKTETTGKSADPKFISITKLLTVERDPWTPESLIERTLKHLSEYDAILMLRAIWEGALIHYQLVEIPVALLQQLATVQLQPVAQRAGMAGRVRISLTATVCKDDGTRLFRVVFDATDGKCQIKNLDIRACALLMEWDLHAGDAIRIF